MEGPHAGKGLEVHGEARGMTDQVGAGGTQEPGGGGGMMNHNGA